MPGLGDLVQRAFYLGVGMASYAGEKAGKTLADLRVQAQKIADEMVERGEITAEEARRLVDEMVRRAQVSDGQSQKSGEITVEVDAQAAEPRPIEITDDDDDVSDLRQQVDKLQDELRRLKREQ
ncbi:MAG: phasin family protein [Elainellaceae cyanobacterium]